MGLMGRALPWALPALALLAVALRQDLADLGVRLGTAHLVAGRLDEAEVAYRRAVRLGVAAAPLDYNLGVHHYRLGHYPKAQQHFSQALATADPSLVPALLYNRGTSLLRQAETRAGQDTAWARRLLDQAIEDYQRALALEPQAEDARANLALARQRLARLPQPGQAGARPRPASPPQADMARPGKPPAQPTPSPASRTGAGRPDPGREGGGTPGQVRDLGQDQVDRLLSQARQREALSGRPLAGRATGHEPGPEKDW